MQVMDISAGYDGRDHGKRDLEDDGKRVYYYEERRWKCKNLGNYCKEESAHAFKMMNYKGKGRSNRSLYRKHAIDYFMIVGEVADVLIRKLREEGNERNYEEVSLKDGFEETDHENEMKTDCGE